MLQHKFLPDVIFPCNSVPLLFQGNLCCVGSSMFLKKQFGIGYHMTIVKNESVFNREAMNNFVTTYIPGRRSFIFRIIGPYGTQNKNWFASKFYKLGLMFLKH